MADDLLSPFVKLALRPVGWVLSSSLAGALIDEAKRLLGVTEIEQRLELMPGPPVEDDGDPRAQLKERGAELLARRDEDDHPAYEHVLASLAPDEARILRLMAVEGARAVVDVRTRREVVASAITALGEDARLTHADRVPVYIDNLQRLGLVRFSDDPVEPHHYQALEVARGRATRRSLRLTRFGQGFCEVCLPIDTAGFLALKDELLELRQ